MALCVPTEQGHPGKRVWLSEVSVRAVADKIARKTAKIEQGTPYPGTEILEAHGYRKVAGFAVASMGRGVSCSGTKQPT